MSMSHIIRKIEAYEAKEEVTQKKSVIFFGLNYQDEIYKAISRMVSRKDVGDCVVNFEHSELKNLQETIKRYEEWMKTSENICQKVNNEKIKMDDMTEEKILEFLDIAHNKILIKNNYFQEEVNKKMEVLAPYILRTLNMHAGLKVLNLIQSKSPSIHYQGIDVDDKQEGYNLYNKNLCNREDKFFSHLKSQIKLGEASITAIGLPNAAIINEIEADPETRGKFAYVYLYTPISDCWGKLDSYLPFAHEEALKNNKILSIDCSQKTPIQIDALISTIYTPPKMRLREEEIEAGTETTREKALEHEKTLLSRIFSVFSNNNSTKKDKEDRVASLEAYDAPLPFYFISPHPQ